MRHRKKNSGNREGKERVTKECKERHEKMIQVTDKVLAINDA